MVLFIVSVTSNLYAQKKNHVQWALFFEAGHLFLKKTLELIMDNIRDNTYSHDVHSMTEPTVYTEVIRNSLMESPNIAYRQVGANYDKKPTANNIPKK